MWAALSYKHKLANLQHANKTKKEAFKALWYIGNINIYISVTFGLQKYLSWSVL